MISAMSLALAFTARDGLLVLCDGLTTSVTTGTLLCTETTKLVVAPDDRALAVVVVGRATYDDVPINVVLGQHLAEYARDHTADAAWMPALIARYLRDKIHQLTRQSASADVGVGVDGLVIGFSPLGEPDLWTFDDRVVKDTDEAAEVSSFMWPRAVEPVDIATDGWTALPAHSDAGAAVAEQVNLDWEAVSQASADPYSLRGQPLSRLKWQVLSRVSQAIKTEPRTFEEDGVGGRWMMGQLRYEASPLITTHNLGPFPGL